MSLIKLQGNASGTGALTIAAPNTNTDRTLTLPDAGGEVYTSGNILGTVSQSGGVPTGAMIERGSNANGEFVKYADGTMMCMQAITLTGQAVNTATGVLYHNGSTSATGGGAWTFPATFVSTDNLIALAEPSDSGGGQIRYWAKLVGISTTGCSATRILSGDSVASADIPISRLAIGRWF